MVVVMEKKQLSMDDALYMVTLPCGSIRYIDPACLSYLNLLDQYQLDQGDPVHSSEPQAQPFEYAQHLPAKRWQDVFPPEWQHPAHRAVDAVCKNVQASSFEFDKGKLGKSLITVKPLCDAQSNIIALAWHGKPIKVKNHFQTAFENSVVAQWVLKLEPLALFFLSYNIRSVQDLHKHLQTPTFISRFRDACSIKEVNKQTLELFALSDREDFSAKFTQCLDDQVITKLAHALFQIEGSLSRRQDVIQTIKTGSGDKKVWMSFDLPEQQAGERSNIVLFNALDISVFKQTEKNLEEKEEFLDAVVTAVPDYLLVVDLNTLTPVFANKSLIENFGYKKQDIDDVFEFFKNITHPEDIIPDNMLSHISKRLSDGHLYETSLRLRKKDGEWRQVYFRCAPMEKNSKRVRSAVVVARDITDIASAEEMLTKLKNKYQILADNFQDLVIATDKQLNINFISPSVEKVLGYSVQEFMDLESPFTHLRLDTKKSFFERVLLDAQICLIENAYSEVIDLSVPTKAGNIIQLEANVSVLKDSLGKSEGMLFVLQDVTQRNIDNRDRLLAAKVFEVSTDGIYITDDKGTIQQVNNAFCEITGYSRESIVGKKPSAFSSGWHDGDFESDIKPSLVQFGTWSGELMSRRANGAAFFGDINISSIKNNDGNVTGFITSFRDITEEKSSTEKIKKLAYYDPLTELPNRMLFLDRLSQAMQRGLRNRHYVAVLFLDLDGFKPVNDRYGHALGDKLLSQVAMRLGECVRGDDTVARMGGDEFAFVLHSLKNKHVAEKTAAKACRKILDALKPTFELEGKPVSVGASIGIALYPDDSIDRNLLLRYADIAMYHAKKSGKNQYQFFMNDMHTRDVKRQKVAQSIEHAIENDQLCLEFQPQFNAQSLQLTGFEALLRWHHPDGRVLKPASFLRELNEVGLGKKTGELVFHLACQKLEQLNSQGFSGTMNINVFSRHYRDGQLLSFIQSLLEKYNIQASQLVLDINESILMDDPGFAYSCLSALKQLGLTIVMDDFARSDVALKNLRRMPIDEVKIDRQHIMNMDKDTEQAQFVEVLVQLAKGLGKRVSVEGIERESQLELLQATELSSLQGYLMAKPMPVEQLDEYIKAQVGLKF